MVLPWCSLTDANLLTKLIIDGTASKPVKSPMDILLDSEKALGERASIMRALERAGAETYHCRQPQPAAASGGAQTAAPPPTSPPPQEADEFEDCEERPSQLEAEWLQKSSRESLERSRKSPEQLMKHNTKHGK